MDSYSSYHSMLMSSVATIVLAGSAFWVSSSSSTITRNNNSKSKTKSSSNGSSNSALSKADDDYSLLPCIRNRRSVFPKDFLRDAPPLDPAIVQSMLDAALWAPFHGRCYADQDHPARFVVLGKESMRAMQRMTLDYYDRNWQASGWGNDEAAYRKWRQMTEGEIEGRWGPCDYMIAIVMRRRTGPKEFPEWEQAAAVAAAVQNMHLQSTKFPHLACYWSSWHNKARDSDEMKQFLDMDADDKCHGFFIVAQAKNPNVKDRRKRDPSLMSQEWRP